MSHAKEGLMASRIFAGISALTSLTLSSLALADGTLTLDLGSTTAMSARAEQLATSSQRANKTGLAGESVVIDFSGYVLGTAVNDVQAAAD